MNESRIPPRIFVKRRLLSVSVLLVLVFTSLAAKEFVHIFTSKGVYETCEDLWFKCLVLNDSTLEVSANSHTAYVDIVNPSDSVVWSEKYRIINGECDGHVFVGENWQSGEYKMFVNTHNSIGLSDSTVFPKRLLIVNELPEVPSFLKSASERVSYLDVPESLSSGLKVDIELDSTEYHTRCKVKATIRVVDSIGNPVQALVTLSVFDGLYSYIPSEVDLVSQCRGVKQTKLGSDYAIDSLFLSDSPVSGHLEYSKHNTHNSLIGQFINVFDTSSKKGQYSIIQTHEEGNFEVTPEIAYSLGKELLLKPVSANELNPKIVFDSPFDKISDIRRKAKEIDFPIIRRNRENVNETDTSDYSHRRIIHLDEITIKSKASIYPKRNKLMGFLDSISSMTDNAWVCGCPNPYGGTFLNDYIEGYTHHPHGVTYEPKHISKPKKGETYELIKYEWTGSHYYVKDIQSITYMGPNYSEEELLRLNGLWKTRGYYSRHRFQNPSEEEMLSGLDDNRNTLIWIPRAQTNEEGMLSLEFYTSDITSLFKISGFVYSPLHGKGIITDATFVVL